MSNDTIDRESFLWRSCKSDEAYREAKRQLETEEQARKRELVRQCALDRLRERSNPIDTQAALLSQLSRVFDVLDRMQRQMNDPQWLVAKLLSVAASNSDGLKDAIAKSVLDIIEEYEGGQE